MFESDRSAARANMRPVACVAFRHESPLGNGGRPALRRCNANPSRACSLFRAAVGDGEGRPPRACADYELTIDEKDVPDGVTIERWIEWA